MLHQPVQASPAGQHRQLQVERLAQQGAKLAQARDGSHGLVLVVRSFRLTREYEPVPVFSSVPIELCIDVVTPVVPNLRGYSIDANAAPRSL